MYSQSVALNMLFSSGCVLYSISTKSINSKLKAGYDVPSLLDSMNSDGEQDFFLAEMFYMYEFSK